MLQHNTLGTRALYGALGATGLFLLGGCPSEAPGEPPAGQWYAGDFHVHSSVGSNDTYDSEGQGLSWPRDIAAVARERGMSFVTVTDHSNSAGSVTHTTMEFEDRWNEGPEFPLWETAAALTTQDFLFINGSEISPVSYLDPAICEDCSETGEKLEPVGHIGCVPRSLETFDTTGAIIDRPPGAVTGKMAVDQCLERNGFAILNHPYSDPVVWLTYDWTSFDYNAIEVWNGSAGYSFMDHAAYDAYLCDRLAGRDVVAVGGSDNHVTHVPYHDNPINLRPPLGMPMTSVFADALEWDRIMTAVSNGRIVIHDKGSFVQFHVRADAQYVGGIGDTIRISQLKEPSVTMRLRGESTLAQELRVTHVAPDGCNDPRAAFTSSLPEVTRNVVHEQRVCETESPCTFETDLTLELKPGLYFATLGSPNRSALNLRNIAMTNVLTIQ